MLFPRNVQNTKDCFAVEVGRRLQHHMDEAKQQEWWERWLKRYWENRLRGAPAGELEVSEVAQMLEWLPHLTAVFPEAVNLAVQMTVGPSRDCWVIEKLCRSDYGGAIPNH